jgi:hypothetical protein
VKIPKELVSCHQKAGVAEQSITNFNGDGGEHSHTEKCRVEGHRVVKIPKKLVSCHKNAVHPVPPRNKLHWGWG